MGIELHPPNVNVSDYDFSIEDREGRAPSIRFGLGAIKNVGAAPVGMILEARTKGPFKDLNDFSRRVDLRLVGKRALESLIRVGALDDFGTRDKMDRSIDRILAMSASHFRAAQSGQLSFFGEEVGLEMEIDLSGTSFQDNRAHLEWERELLGLFVSDHPLAPYVPLLKRLISHTSPQLAETIHDESVTIGGVITRYRQHNTRNGAQMGFATLDDMHGNIELVIFAKAWEKFRNLIGIDQVILATGKVDHQNGDPKVKVDSIELVALDPDDEEWEEPTTRGAEASGPIAPGEERVNPDTMDGGLPEMGLDASEASVSAYTGFLGEENKPGGSVRDPGVEGMYNPTAANPVEQLVPTQIDETVEILSIPPYLTSSHQVSGASAVNSNPRMLRVVMQSNGDKGRDCRRLRCVYGALRSSPGGDRFSFQVYERDHQYLIEFPNETTGISKELMARLAELVGTDNIVVETLL